MLVVSWNLHGASVPGKASDDQQQRAWEYIRDLGADLVFAQEVSGAAIPEWACDEWTLLRGKVGRFRKTWDWGSVIAARPYLQLRPIEVQDSWFAHLYDLVLLGEVNLPGSGPILVSSVHTAALSVQDWIRTYRLRDLRAIPFPLSDDELVTLQRPGCRELPFINDFGFTALDRLTKGKRFLVAGDWNTCRKYAGGPEFFVRAQERGWVECHQPPEEQSFLPTGTGKFQLDHAFCDGATAGLVKSCRVRVDDHIPHLSDHAPLLLQLEGVRVVP